MLRVVEVRDSDALAAQCRSSLRVDRRAATDLALETLHWVAKGNYTTTAGKEVPLARRVDRAIEGTIGVPPTTPVAIPQRLDQAATDVEIANETSLSAARRLIDEGHDPLILNMANGVTPGGSLLFGGRGQEEYLCRSSALWSTIRDNPMYAAHAEQGNLECSDWAILSPDVPIIRDDDGLPLGSPWLASFITCAAPYTHRVGRGRSREIMASRVERLLTIAASHGYKSLILGAWGCGAFGNEPTVVANAFLAALTGPLSDCFQRITFAIPDWSEDRRNLEPFINVFQAVGRSRPSTEHATAWHHTVASDGTAKVLATHPKQLNEEITLVAEAVRPTGIRLHHGINRLGESVDVLLLQPPQMTPTQQERLIYRTQVLQHLKTNHVLQIKSSSLPSVSGGLCSASDFIAWESVPKFTLQDTHNIGGLSHVEMLALAAGTARGLAVLAACAAPIGAISPLAVALTTRGPVIADYGDVVRKIEIHEPTRDDVYAWGVLMQWTLNELTSATRFPDPLGRLVDRALDSGRERRPTAEQIVRRLTRDQPLSDYIRPKWERIAGVARSLHEAENVALMGIAGRRVIGRPHDSPPVGRHAAKLPPTVLRRDEGLGISRIMAADDERTALFVPDSSEDPPYTQEITRIGSDAHGQSGGLTLGKTRKNELVTVWEIPNMGSSTEDQELLRTRIEDLKKVSSPYLARVHNYSLVRGRGYVAWQYVPGPTLASAPSRLSPLDDDETLALAAALAQALSAITSKGFQHGAVNPTNVVLSEPGPVLIAQGWNQPDDVPTVKHQPGVTRSWTWTAPELRHRNGNPTPRSDIWSWGQCLFWSLLNLAPDSEFSLPLRDLVLMALSDDPSDRPRAVDIVMTLTGGRPVDEFVTVRWERISGYARGVRDTDETLALFPPGALPGRRAR